MVSYLQITTLRQWPYKNLSKADQHVVARFFDSVPFFARGWDIYHYETNSRDFFLIPFTQISEFFAQITSETGIAAFSNVLTKKVAFRIDYDNDDEPIFLGTIESKEDFDRLKESNSWNDDGNGRGPQHKLNKKIKAQEKRNTNMAGWRSQVESAMHHLGFTTKENASDEYPVFVSVDVESYEFNHSSITEIGISILDTYQLPDKNAQYVTSGEPPHPNSALPRNNISSAPKSRGEAILALVESHHFRITENRFLRNGTFVSDAADRFEFGQSEFISLSNAPMAVAKCFRHFDEEGQRRKIVLVGHDVKTDIDYLKAIGYDVTNIANLETIDTACMWRAMKWETQSRSLNMILMDLELEYWNLHNAGNDAAYTLQALIKMAERGLPEKPETPESEAPAVKPRVVVRAEDIEISFIEDDEDASSRPIGWKAARQSRAVVKPVPIPAQTPTQGCYSEGSPLSVNGDGW